MKKPVADIAVNPAARLLALASAVAVLSLAYGQTVSFPVFTSDSLKLWMWVPGVQPVNMSLQLTSNTSSSPGAAFWNSVQLVNNDFTIAFSFQILGSGGNTDASNNGNGADGLSLLMTNALPVNNGIWGQMGYEWAQPMTYKSVAIEFDTHYDAGVDPVDTMGPNGEQQVVGPDGNHVGININGRTESVAKAHIPGLLNDGNVHFVWVTYQVADRATLKVYHNPIEKVMPVMPVLKATVPLTEILDTSNVFFGFTAGCQSSMAFHTLLSMDFIQGRADTATAASRRISAPTFVPQNKTEETLTLVSKSSVPNLLADSKSWVLTPSAYVNESGNLMLTTSGWAAPGSVSMVIGTAPVNATFGFSLHIAFQMSGAGGSLDTANDGLGGNGLALLLLPGSNLPTAQSANGPGYQGITPSVAIEFDTFYNPGDDPVNTVNSMTGQQEVQGPDGNHIAISRDGNLASLVAAHIPDLMNDGYVKNAWIDYYAKNNTLLVYYNAISASKPALPVLAHMLNIKEVIGQSSVYVGFTAACPKEPVSTYQNHTIVFANFTEATASSVPGPAPGSPAARKAAEQARTKKNTKLAAIVIPVLFGVVIGGGCVYGIIMYIIRKGRCPGQADIYKDPEDFKSLNAHSPTYTTHTPTYAARRE